MKNKKLIETAGKIYGRGAKGEEKYFSGSLFDAFLLEDDRILTVEKIKIQTNFCFGEHGYDFEEKQEMARGARCFSYFKQENTQELKKDLETLKEALEKFEEDTTDKPILFFYRLFWTDGTERLAGWYIQDLRKWASRRACEFEEVRPATKKELETLTTLKKAQFEDLEKRLATWWKRYGAEKLHTWTYWADA